jgi:Glycosyl transferases group 1
VLFYRDFKRFTGGDLKVWDYFNHVRSSERHTALVRFTADSAWGPTNPWTAAREHVIGEDDDVDFDVLFLSGIDWRGMIPIEERAEYRRPIINLVQHVWHACPNDPLNRHRFLPHKAIRICVSPQIDKAIGATGRVRGPIFMIPNGLDLEAVSAMADATARDIDVLVAANKRPELGQAVAARLRREGRVVELVDERIPRWELIRLMSRARVNVLVPNPKEGFYLPALEAMAVGTVVVCPDCIGNRSFCLPGENCFRPEHDEDAIVTAAETALREEPGLDELRGRALATAQAHDIAGERAAFLDILDGAEELWAAA